MSNEQPAKNQPAKRDAIPCRSLNFGTKRMKPNGEMSDVVIAETQQNRPRFTIEYMPALGFYRVAYYEPSATEPKKVVLYPREWASFEPVPL